MTAGDATSSHDAAAVALLAFALPALFAIWHRLAPGWIAVAIGAVGGVRLLRQQGRLFAAGTRDGQRC